MSTDSAANTPALNKRALYVIVAIQALFVAALIYVGSVARDSRRIEYLELSHRVASGQGTPADFLKVRGVLPVDAGPEAIRALLGLPVQTATTLTFTDAKLGQQNGRFWLYYPHVPATASTPARVIGPAEARALNGPIQTFVLSFDPAGRVRGELIEVQHPIEATPDPKL